MLCLKKNTMKKENKNAVKRVKIEDQPLSSYRYIAYQKGFNTIEEMAVYHDVDRAKLEALIIADGQRRSKICTGYIRELKKEQYDEQRFYKGHQYTNKEICELTGLPKSTVEKRIQHKWRVERILAEARRPLNDYDLVIDDVRYSTIREAAEAYDINAVTVQSRLAKGMALKEAVQATTCRNGGQTAKEIYVFGECYESEKAACKAKGVNYATFKSMKRQHPNISTETIIMQQMNQTPYRYIVYGEKYRTLKAVSIAYDVKYSRLYAGMKDPKYSTIEEIIEAAHKKDQKSWKKKEKVFKHTVLGVGYTTITGACKANGVKPDFVYQKRRENGFTVEEAIQYALENGVGLTV